MVFKRVYGGCLALFGTAAAIAAAIATIVIAIGAVFGMVVGLFGALGWLLLRWRRERRTR